jgi:hypothetical protein
MRKNFRHSPERDARDQEHPKRMVHVALFLRKADITDLPQRTCAYNQGSETSARVHHPRAFDSAHGLWFFRLCNEDKFAPSWEEKQNERKAQTPLKTKPSAHGTRLVSNYRTHKTITKPHAGGPV